MTETQSSVDFNGAAEVCGTSDPDRLSLLVGRVHCYPIDCLLLASVDRGFLATVAPFFFAFPDI